MLSIKHLLGNYRQARSLLRLRERPLAPLRSTNGIREELKKPSPHLDRKNLLKSKTGVGWPPGGRGMQIDEGQAAPGASPLPGARPGSRRCGVPGQGSHGRGARAGTVQRSHLGRQIGNRGYRGTDNDGGFLLVGVVWTILWPRHGAH